MLNEVKHLGQEEESSIVSAASLASPPSSFASLRMTDSGEL
jgi:hypothetical protein